MSYLDDRHGVECRRIRSRGRRYKSPKGDIWNEIPKVHVEVWIDDEWELACAHRSYPGFTAVGNDEPVTCKLCLRTGVGL